MHNLGFVSLAFGWIGVSTSGATFWSASCIVVLFSPIPKFPTTKDSAGTGAPLVLQHSKNRKNDRISTFNPEVLSHFQIFIFFYFLGLLLTTHNNFFILSTLEIRKKLPMQKQKRFCAFLWPIPFVF